MSERLMSLVDFMGKLTIDGNPIDVHDDHDLLHGNTPWKSIDPFYTYTDDEGTQFPVKFIKQEGGGEGGAEYCETILKVGEDYLKVTYNYYSHHGYETEDADVYLVKPVQKTITVYE